MSGHKGMGAHQSSRALTNTWLTPPELLELLGVPTFDLDPATPVELPLYQGRPWPLPPRRFTELDDGLRQPWEGRVWLNPPYSGVGEMDRWMARLAQHGNGVALVFARTETSWFHDSVWPKATALFFFRSRLHFHHGCDVPNKAGQRSYANAGAPSCLVAYGEENAQLLAGLRVPGYFQRLSGTCT